jgi:transcriptional regulator with XRE-family HTH domain
MNIPYTISQLRQKGLSQKVIGQEIGCSQPTVCQMEAGLCGTKRPSFALVSNLQALAARHGVSTDPPLMGTETAPPDSTT